MKKFLRKTYAWLVLAPILSIALGLLSNQAVLVANGDTFPVMVNPTKVAEFSKYSSCNDAAPLLMVLGLNTFSVWHSVYAEPNCKLTNRYGMLDDTHKWMNYNHQKTHLNALADIIDVQNAIMSIGDVLIFLGEALLGYGATFWLFAAIMELYRRQEA